MCVCLADYIEPRRDSFPQLEAVRADVDAFVGEAEQFDDLTMLCLQYLGPRAQ